MPRDRRAVIGSGMWSEPSIRSLTRLQQQAYALAYTQPDLNRCGVLAYRPRYWANLSAGATEEELRIDFEALHDTRHVVLDDTDEQMLIRTYVRWDGLLTQPLVIAAMVRDYFNITSPAIKLAFLAEIRRLHDLPDLEPKERQGVALAIGADPAEHGVKNAPQVAKAIGSGLAGPLADAIRNGHVEPFTPEGLPKGMSEGLREGLTKGPPKGQREGQPDPSVDPQGQGQSRIPVSTPVSTPVPISTPAPTDDPTGVLLAEHAAAYTEPLPPSSLTPVRTAIMRQVAERTPPDRIRAGLARMRERKVGPSLLPQLIAEVTPTNSRPQPSRNDLILDRAMQRAQAAEAQQRRALP
jgi:hypothetical protein